MRKIGKKYILLTNTEYDEKVAKHFQDGYERGKEDSKDRVEQLETALERKEKTLQKTHRKLDDAEEAVKVYEEERDKARDVVKQGILNDDLKSTLDARKEAQDAREAKLKDRETLLNSEESSEYKKGYADGVSDGVRKIHEITAEDRKDAMKIAMVSAASHSKVDNLKEVNNEFSITAGSTNKEA